jgi:hypothetical protein
MGEVSKVFFFEKKNQKTFVSWRPWPESFRLLRSRGFLFLFEKEGLSS